jgi:arsenate reductase
MMASPHPVPATTDAARPPLPRRLLAEAIGSILLAAVVVGSGIAAERLSPGDVGLQLLQNSAATAAGLYAIILIMGPVSGAHLNPVVSLVDAALARPPRRGADRPGAPPTATPWSAPAAYLTAQIAGCIAGAMLADAMFAEPLVSFSSTHRATAAHLLAEVIATAGLVLVIFGPVRAGRGHLVPAGVACYIGAAYWFTSSTSFANPAITVGRMFSDTFAGIAPGSAPAFVAAQLLGGGLGLVLVAQLYPEVAE